jgi:hypothetical protein
MMKKSFVAVAILLAGCGGGGAGAGGGASICALMGGGDSQVSATPNSGSSFSNAGNAFDGNLDSIATLTAGALNGGGTIRGTAQSGVLAPAGSVAGMFITTPTSGTLTVTINTYLSGARQEGGQVDRETYGSNPGQNCTPGDVCENKDDGVSSYYGLPTTKQYNAIEAVLAWNGSSPLQIHELCVQ